MVHHKPLLDQCADAYPSAPIMTKIQTALQYTPDSSDDEEDFQMVPLDDDHWTSEEMPERTFCIHEQGLPHNLCQYPCPYGSNNIPSYMDSLDLSDILDYEDYMVTSSDEEIPGMEEVPILTLNSGLLELLLLPIYLLFWL